LKRSEGVQLTVEERGKFPSESMTHHEVLWVALMYPSH
jgi:hypothetical protein